VNNNLLWRLPMVIDRRYKDAHLLSSAILDNAARGNL
jgi:hypothetical protein